jgi:hypothetical protein
MSDDLALNDGGAVSMGNGVWVIRQDDEHGVSQNVVLTRADMEAMLAAA